MLACPKPLGRMLDASTLQIETRERSPILSYHHTRLMKGPISDQLEALSESLT